MIDSLFTLIKKDKADTNKVLHLDRLSVQFRETGYYDTSLVYANQALQLAQKLNFKKGIAYCYGNISLIYKYKSDFPAAIENQLTSLNINKEIGDKKAMGSNYNNIGIIYRAMGNYPEALKYLFLSLRIKDELGDKKGVASTYNNIGNIYFAQKDFDGALKNYKDALKINEATKNRTWAANNYSNIGNVYESLGNHDEALLNLYSALGIFENLKDKKGITSCYVNIGSIYHDEKNYDEALNYYMKALTIREGMDDREGMATCYMNMGGEEIDLHHLTLAGTYFSKALELSKEINSNEDLRDTYAGLVDWDTVIGNYKDAFRNYKAYILYRDSLNNQENTKKTVQAQMNYEFAKKTSDDSLKNAQQTALKDLQTQATLEHEKTKRYALYGGLALLVVFGGFMFNRFLVTNRQKKIIEIKNRETEEQKDIIEEKQKEIVDSINYAKRIQYTLLANDKLLWANLNSNFVFFKPKDIVSGDFYWATKKENRFYLACCDCTGHGVPGAFMSLLNISFLNEAIIEKNIVEPNEVLNHVRKRLIENISQSGAQDGMDAILICMDKTNHTISYSAAHNAPVLIQNGAIKNLPYDKMPVGKGEKTDSFTLFTIDFQKGDSLYLFTDGYADQFGGRKGKKFKYKQLEELLLAIEKQSAKEQQQILLQKFEEWRGNLEQVDDVLVIGIKI
jgi:serine phosphatase RsbU (regulator of sigma subunit)